MYKYSFLPECGNRLLLKNQGIIAGERLFLKGIFRGREPFIEYTTFMNRIREISFFPAGQLHLHGLLEDEERISSKWEHSVLAFPGTLYTLRFRFYECFCIPVMMFVDGKWLTDAYCSKRLANPDMRVVFTSNPTRVH